MKEEKGPLVLLIIFGVFSILFGVMAYLNYRALQPANAELAPDSQMRELRAQIERLDSDASLYRQQAAKLQQDIEEQHEAYDFSAGLADMYETEFNRRSQLVKAGDAFDKQAGDLSLNVSRLKNQTLADLDAETRKTSDEMDKGLSERNQTKDGSVGRLRQLKEDFEADTRKQRQSRNYLQSRLDEAKSVLGDLTQREVERATVFNEPDGRVLLADNIGGTIVINLGTAQGVKNGFIFECFAMRPGKEHVTKGYLEVRHAARNESDCLLMRRPSDLPKDSMSPYIASQPEERFSPYSESGRKGFSAQPLSGGVVSAVLGVNVKDPIIEGDYVQNPFYSPRKKLTFYIAGNKEIVNGQQKSAIRYRWTEIQAVIESYGAKVVPAIDTNVNYILAQKNAKSDDPEFQKGVDVGIPVIYEWEAFRFLDNR